MVSRNSSLPPFITSSISPTSSRTRRRCWERLQSAGIKGSLLITSEGVNSTISGTREAIDGFLAYLQADIVKGPIRWKESQAEFQPFGKARVRLKKETIGLGEPVSMKRFGHYVEPADWNALIAREGRRHHRYAQRLRGQSRHLPKRLSIPASRISSICRNGRATTPTPCAARPSPPFAPAAFAAEKFTSWLIDHGFEDVHHLRGGILQYFEDVPAEQSLWQGECFVFDERIAVDHALQPSTTAVLCLFCDHALTAEDQASTAYVKGQFLPTLPRAIGARPLSPQNGADQVLITAARARHKHDNPSPY